MSRTIHDLPTPSILLDANTLERNVKRMSEKVRGFGAKLRPHVKTHKCPDIGRLQLRQGAQGITVASIPEARDFADAGFEDITWAVPLSLSRLEEALSLARRVTLRLLVDSMAAAEALDAAARKAGLRVHVFLEIDCGDHRSGVDPAHPDALALARHIAGSSALIFDGLLTHGGHSYGLKDDEARRRVASQERDISAAFAERLRGEGLTVTDVSIGSTPGMSAIDSLAGVTEARPGNYVFHDYVQVAAGVCRPEDVAVSVLSTVISKQPGLRHCIVDAGALAMSKDQGPGIRGLGPVMAGLTGSALTDDVTLTRVSQEHGFIEGGSFRVGDRVRIMPNHSCLTAAMFDHYYLVDGEKVIDRLAIRRAR